MKTTHKWLWADLVTQGGAGVLALLFGYAALSKLLHYGISRMEMRNQVFPDRVAEVLTWAVPTVELAVVALLLYRPFRLLGLYGSAVLLAAFSLYIGLVFIGMFGRVPCSCGGILGRLGYGEHLVFNLFFLALSIVAILSHSRAKFWRTQGDGLASRMREGGGG